MYASPTVSLDLLQAEMGDGVVEGCEILIQQADESRRLGAFRQQREALKVREQYGRGARISRLHFAVPLELVGNRNRQDVVEQLLGPRLR
jgi:hypothetical protein